MNHHRDKPNLPGIWTGFWLGVLTTGALGIAPSPGLAQAYSESERITLVDLPVELRSGSDAAGGARRPPDGLSVDDFSLSIDGEPRELLALARLSEAGPQPYQVVIYLDSELSDSREIRATLDWLAARTVALTGLAAVDLVVADPEPRFVLRDVGDPDLLEQALLSADWEEGAADQLRALRAGYLEAVADPEAGDDRETLVTAFRDEEVRLVQERSDLMLSFLAERGLTGAARALLLAGFQYDLDPRSFYGSSSSDGGPESPGLEEETRDLAASLAGNGWIVLPIAAPEPTSPLVPGKRIGKWRIAGPAGGRVIGLRIARESERDSEQAQAYLDNAQALLEQGSVVEAEQAFRDALHYFYGDPRTASAQAEALLGLASALEAQGRSDEARVSRRLAADLDASLTEEVAGSQAILLDPHAALAELAAPSSGHVIASEDDLTTVFRDLRQRVRLSFQFEGEPTGDLYRVDLRVRIPGWAAASAEWVRFGPTAAVAAARTRLLMGGWSVDAPADLEAKLQRDAAGSLTMLDLRLHSPSSGESGAGESGERAKESPCRLTLGTGSAEGADVRIESHLIACRQSDLGLLASVPLASTLLAGDAEFVTLELENLASTVWGIDVLELN